MTSFMTTMFVTSSPNPVPSPPRPLPPVFTLAESQSCIRLDLESYLSSEKFAHSGRNHEPRTPDATYASPLQRAFREALRNQYGNHQDLQSLRRPPPAPPHKTPYDHDPQSYTNYALRSCDTNGLDWDKNNLLDMVHSNSRTRAPFKPTRSNKGTSSWQLKQFAEATLGSGSLRKAVKLPEGEDQNEWLAVNVVDFYNQINLLYGSITEFCSPQSCPEMKATDEFEYLWQDSENYKRPTKMPAPEYVEHLMSWIQSNIDNESSFPSRIGVPFPRTFPALIKQMFKRLYRVYAHVYCHHYPVVIQLGLEPHLNTSFKHYVLFVDEHKLAEGSKDFWGPLGDLVESMLKSD